jgi:hypothetical protein
MSQGPSGRMVVELEPELKRRLYAALAVDGVTFKQWLIWQTEHFLSDRDQPFLFAAEPLPPLYGKQSRS